MSGQNSYNNLRINKTTRDAVHSARYPSFSTIDYVDSVTAFLEGYRLQDHPSGHIHRIQDYYNIEQQGIWTLDFTSRSVDIVNKSCGIVDNLIGIGDPRVANRFVLLFALYDKQNQTELKDDKWDDINYNFIGYGLFHQPKSISTALSSGTKGSIADVTLDTLSYNTAFQFTEGARVLFWSSSGNWNVAQINSITNSTQMNVTLFNHGTGYGFNLTGGAFTIVQLDKFRPYVANEKNKNYIDNYQLITGVFRLEAGLTLKQFGYQSGHS